MYQVMIVDDEPFIRFGLKQSVDWENEGLHLIGTFANGQEAIQIAKNHRVDILITDIKMPVMDGMLLTKKILEVQPHVKVIFVSGYNDFEFVREGIKLGVVDYILKPTLEPEEMLELVKQCVQMLEKEKEVNNDHWKSQHGNHKDQYQKTLKRYVSKKGQLPSPNHLPEWLKGEYLAIYLTLDQKDELEENYGALHHTILLEDLQQAICLYSEEAITLSADKGIICLIPKKDEEKLNSLQQLKVCIQNEVDFTFTIGYQSGDSLEQLNTCIDQSIKASERCFFEGRDKIFGYLPAIREDIDVNMERMNQRVRDLKKTLLTGGETQDVLESWMKQWDTYPSSKLIKKEASEILSILFHEHSYSSFLLDRLEMIRQAETLSELKKRLQEQIEECNGLFVFKYEDSDTNHTLIKKSLEYIHQHFTNELTLQIVAEQVHISKNYYCVLFKKYMERNFIDYIIDLRLARAKQLLLESELRVYEVAENSGFNDVKYFSKLFKKITKHSPAEFREQHRI